MIPKPYDELTEEEITALCLYREAEGESYLGKRCIAHAIKNRTTHPDWPHSIHGVILQPNQFSSFNENNPRANVWIDDNLPAGQDCYTIARAVLAGTDTDITDGAVYYANLMAMTPGGWFMRNISSRPDLHPVTITIGKHTFYT